MRGIDGRVESRPDSVEQRQHPDEAEQHR
jgi:hypothetical protein